MPKFFSLYNKCPNPYYGHDVIRLIMSSIYISNINIIDEKKLVEATLSKAFSSSQILAEILSVYSFLLTEERNNLFSVFILEGQEAINQGAFSALSNKIDMHADLNSNIDTFVHEITHKVIHDLLNEKPTANPYRTEAQKKFFKNCLHEMLVLIKDFVNQKYSTKIDFSEFATTFQMGKELARILFMGKNQLLRIHDEVDLSAIADDFDLTFAKLPLYNISLIEAAFVVGNQYLLEWLINKGVTSQVNNIIADQTLNLVSKDILEWIFINNVSVTIRGNQDTCNEEKYIYIAHKIPVDKFMLQRELFNGNIELLRTIIKHVPSLSYNEVEYFKYEILPFLDEKGEISQLFSLYVQENDNWYNYFSLLFRHSHEPNLCWEENLPFSQDVEISALSSILDPYKQLMYFEFNEDEEVVVRLPEIIASNRFYGDIAKLIAPLYEYWQMIISPEIASYIADNYNTCCPVINKAELS